MRFFVQRIRNEPGFIRSDQFINEKCKTQNSKGILLKPLQPVWGHEHENWPKRNHNFSLLPFYGVWIHIIIHKPSSADKRLLNDKYF
jgi:hypothetical protein